MTSSLFADDILTDDLVLYGTLGAPHSPERSLLEAMLFRAADDILKYPANHLIHRNAVAWIQAEDYEQHGFGWACIFLGLSPQATARAMMEGKGLRWRERIRFNQMAPVKERVRERVRALREVRRVNG